MSATSAQTKGGGRDSSDCWSLSHWILVGVIWNNGYEMVDMAIDNWEYDSNMQDGIKLTFNSWRKAFESFVDGTPWPLPWSIWNQTWFTSKLEQNKKRRGKLLNNKKIPMNNSAYLSQFLGGQIGHFWTTLLLGLLDRLGTADSANIGRLQVLYKQIWNWSNNLHA